VPVDVGLARLSNDLIYGGILAYSVGFLGFAMDAAFGNHVAAAKQPVGARVKVPVLAGVGAASSGASGISASESAAPASSGLLTSRSRSGRMSRWGSAIARRVGAVAMLFTLAGWALHAGAILTRGLSVHRLPWGNMYEFTLALTFAAVTAFLVISTRHRARYLGVFLMAPVVLALGIAVLVLYVPAAPLMPALQSYWLAIHVSAATIAFGVFAVGAVATLMFLVADRYAAAITAGKPVRFTSLARIMPDAETLDRMAYRLHAFAFPIWTFAVIAGAIWAEYAWGHYWQWDPKETWAFITWIVYAGYLHARATAGWRGRKAAYVALFGIATLLFNFFVVNIFISGMHSYAGI
jgi:cytochrome c-type biogenesis protein CcsB